eukprot:s4645_g5.t1
MGPEKKVRWRGGTPPSPPAWRYDPSDLRAYNKWARKVQIWQVQIQNYMTKREAALLLYTSLTGEAEAELEHVPLEKINCDGGISYILESLKEPMAQKSVSQKRKFLADYENISRYPSEGLRTYANRYRRIERSLEALGVQITGMYDDESRGNRLLERARLSAPDQRLVLVGARYSLSFDFRAPPPVVGRQPASSTTKPPVYGQGKGGYPPKRVFVAETGEHHETETPGNDGDEATFETIPEADVEDDEDPTTGQDDQGDDDDDGELQDLAQVLTVTARRLASTRLGRKYSGAKASPAELKKRTTCAVCGEVGHWKGDPECKVSGDKGAASKHAPGKGAANTSQQTSNKGSQRPGKGQAHQALTVTHSDLRTWAHQHFGLIERMGLTIGKALVHDNFQFGKGAPVAADFRAYLPITVGHHDPVLIGTGVVNANVPLLASNVLLKALGMILNLNNMTVKFASLGVTAHVVMLGGHLAVRISDFTPSAVSECAVLLQHDAWEDAPPEVLFGSGRQTRLTVPKDADSPAVHLYMYMVRAARLGILWDRQWLLEATPPKLDPRFQVSQATCPHSEIQRYGNATGRYSRCKACNKRWQWDGDRERWVHKPYVASSRSSALPLPSSGNTLKAPPRTSAPSSTSLRAARPKTTRPTPATSSVTSACWVRFGNSTILVAMEQLRKAVGWEDWCPDEADIQCLKDATVDLKNSIFQDQRGPPPNEDLPDMDEELADMPVEAETPAYFDGQSTPAPQLVAPRTSGSERSQPATTAARIDSNYNLTLSPTYQQTTYVHQRFGDPMRSANVAPRTPRTPRHTRSRSPAPPTRQLPQPAERAQLPEGAAFDDNLRTAAFDSAEYGSAAYQEQDDEVGQVLQTNNNHDRFLIYLVSINRCFVSFVFYVQGKDI